MHHVSHSWVSSRDLVFLSFLLLIIASQVFWIVKIWRWKQKLLQNKALKRWLDVIGAAVYAVLFFHGFFGVRRTPSPTRLTLTAALLEGPFLWWLFGSLFGFIFYLLIKACGLFLQAGFWSAQRPRSEPRRL